MDWTKEQSDAIYKKDSNILVAAAAGSGKTAVLVERIIQKILTDKIDIDKLLVVTFTNAAASEMRERVLEAIYKKIDENPDDVNLQKQIILLGKSNICTIHSFCLDVIKNNFFEIDLSANFRIASEEENELLKQEVLDDVFENLYEEDDNDFAELVNTYTSYRGDEPLKEMVLRIYRFMQSAAFPNEWLSEKIEMFNFLDEVDDFSNTSWGRILLDNLKEETKDAINSLKMLEKELVRFPELQPIYNIIESDIIKYKDFFETLDVSWDDSYEKGLNMSFDRWKDVKECTLDIKDKAKEIRSTVKDKLKKQIAACLTYNSQAALNDINEMYKLLRVLKDVIFKFDQEFKLRKRQKNVIDFNDIEHYALKILVKKENDKILPTEVAKKYQEKFTEIAIDEYQDSNQVQEFILNMVSKGNNIFMVGDVKQSIYKFRQACPELFLSKYETYSLDGNEKGLKIQLFKNFRSRKNVLDFTNTIFKNIMSKRIGDIDYNETEYLNLGASYDEENEKKAEFDIIDLKEDESIQAWNDEDEEENLDEFERLEKNEIEAKFVAKRIKEIIDSKMIVFDKKKGNRVVTYKDIVILLRSTSNLAPLYERELMLNDIPVFSDSSNEYLDTIEIQTIINVLKVLDNPIDDISLVATLRSQIGLFTDNEIVEIRLCNKELSFYEVLKLARIELENEELRNRVGTFLDKIALWRKESEYKSLSELIWKIYVDTGFYNFVGLMPNGNLRQSNLKMLFERAKEYEKTSFKGLFNFIRFIERLKNTNSDMSSAKVIGENENVVRIMSIHKSKGLEFPVVFLANSAKKINLQDLNSNLLLHQEIGIGPQYINYQRKIEYSTSAKDAIKIIAKEDAISEEMRILYVALTRAKEKLIVTGVSNDYLKQTEKYKQSLEVYQSNDEKINPMIFKKYVSYFDWINLVMLSDKSFWNLMDVNTFSKNDVLKDIELIEEEEEKEFDFEKEESFVELDKEFSWQYNNIELTHLPIKTTVSKIKELHNSESSDFERLQEHLVGIDAITPDFMKDEEDTVIKGSRRGTIIHNFMQRLDLHKEYSIDEINELKSKLVANSIFTEEEAKVIYPNTVIKFMQSNLGAEIRKCPIIEKEKAFCIRIDAKEIDENIENQTILVQGIIDLYGIDSDDKIILVDYKTDFVLENDEISLINKYQKQLSIYKKALEEATGKDVKEVYIYSLGLNKEIRL